MIDILLIVLLALQSAALLVLMFLSNKQIQSEREKSLKIALAKNLPELTDNEMIEKTDPPENRDTESLPSTIKEVSDLSDTDFDKVISDQLTVENGEGV